MSEIQKKYRLVHKVTGQPHGKAYDKFPYLLLKYHPRMVDIYDVVCYTHQLIATETIEFDFAINCRGHGKATLK